MEDVTSISLPAISPLPEGSRLNDIQKLIEERLSASGVFRGISFSKQIIKISIQTKDLVCFLDSLLTVLSLLEAKQVFAGMDTASILEHTLTKLVRVPPNPFLPFENEINNLAGQTIETDTRFAPKYWVMIALVEAFLQEDIDGLDTTQLTSTLKKLQGACSTFPSNKNSEDLMLFKINQLLSRLVRSDKSNEPQQNNQAEQLSPAIEGPKQFQPPGREEIQENNVPRPNLREVQNDMCELKDKEAERDIKNHLGIGGQGRLDRNQGHNSQPFPERMQMNPNVAYLEKKDRNYTDQDFPSINECYPSAGTTPLQYQAHAGNGYAADAHHQQGSHHGWNNGPRIPLSTQAALDSVIDGIITNRSYSFERSKDYRTTIQHILNERPVSIVEVFADLSIIEIWKLCFSCDTNKLEKCISYDNGDKPVECDPLKELYTTHGYYTLNQARGSFFDLILKLYKVKIFKTNKDLEQTMLSTKAALINLKLLWGMHALNNGKDYLRRQGVKLFSQLVMDLESEDLIELGHQCLEEKDDVFYEIRLYALYRKLQLDNNLVDDFSPLYETKYDAEFNYEKFFKSICEDLFRHIGDTEEKVIRESDLTGLIIAVSRKLENKELDLKFLALIRNLWKKCINEEDVDQRRIGFMKGDNIPSEIKRGIFADILETISISTKSKRSESSLAKMFEGIIAWFSKTTEGNKQYSNEIYQVLEKHWLSDFNQILVEIMENNFHQDGKYIHFIYFLQASEDKKAKDLMTKFKEMCLKTINSFKQSDLSLDLLEKFNVNPKNAVLMMRYLKELLDKKKFPNKSERNALKNSENYLEDESSLEKMLRSHSRLNEVVEFTKKILNDNRIFPLLDRRDPKTIQTDLTTNKSTTPLKRLEHWISYKDTHPFMVKTVNITSNELFCNFFGSLSNGEKEMKANLFEQRLQKAWQLFEEHLKKAVKEIDIRSVDGLKQTVEEIQSGKYENCCDLFYDLTSIELKMIVQNYQILDLMANNDLLNAVFITMGSLRKIGRVAETHTTLKFLESLQGHMPRYIEKKEFIRDQSMNIAIDEIKLLDFITRHQELVIELSKWWPLIEHFKNKNFRHYEELLIYRDTTKYESISNETIARLRQVIDTFNSKKEFSSLLEFLETMLQNEADIRNISHSQGTFTSLIECSEEMAQEETGLSKIESILNDSRIMFLLNDKQYSILAGLNRKEDERFNQTEAYLREGSDRGKQSFSFDLMQDYKIRLSFATEDTNLESKRKHYTSLMINLEAIREALNKIKSRGYIKDLKSSFQEKLYKLASESKDKDHIDYTSQSIHIKSGNVMIKVKAKNREFRTENIEFIRVIFKELVSELENDEFESKPENHWVSNLEGNQLEFLTGYLNAKEKEVYSGEQLGILGEILRQAAERKITRGIDMMEVKRSYVEGLEEEEPRTVKKAIKFLGNEYCSVNSKDIVKTSETQSQKRFKIFGFTGDKWTMFFRLLAEMKHEGKNCNQFYFASQHLDEIELKGFVKRALTDTRQKNYFLIDIHLLSTEMKNELMQYCKDRRAQAKNKNLCLFCKQESVNNIYNEFASNSEVFELLHVPTGDKHSKKLPQSYISKIDCLKVTSEMSGLGKTYYIQQSSKHHRLKTLFLSGEVHPESIEKRIGVLDRHDKMQDTTKSTNLHIKLDMMDNMILNCELLDQILFRICYLKMYPYQGGWYSFEDVEMFYLEIGNSYKHELAKHVSFLNVVELSKNIEHLSAKNWQQLDLTRLQGEGGTR
jgi:uncharacterized protein YlbG (UPF0298 family)